MTTVFCLACGAELRRIEDPEGDPGRTCYRWLTPDGSTADNCPGCGAATSLLNTAPAPSPATVAALVQALHFMCAAVRCNYEPATIRYAGYLDAGLEALRAAGWDPDQARPWPPAKLT